MRIMGITGVIMGLVGLEVYLLSRPGPQAVVSQGAGPKACAGCKGIMGPDFASGNHFSEYNTVLHKCKIGTLGGFAIRGTLHASCW